LAEVDSGVIGASISNLLAARKPESSICEVNIAAVKGPIRIRRGLNWQEP